MEEAPESYKDVTQVAETCTDLHLRLAFFAAAPALLLLAASLFCAFSSFGLGHPVESSIRDASNYNSLVPPVLPSAGHEAGISRLCIKLRPIAVVKG